MKITTSSLVISPPHTDLPPEVMRALMREVACAMDRRHTAALGAPATPLATATATSGKQWADSAPDMLAELSALAKRFSPPPVWIVDEDAPAMECIEVVRGRDGGPWTEVVDIYFGTRAEAIKSEMERHRPRTSFLVMGAGAWAEVESRALPRPASATSAWFSPSAVPVVRIARRTAV
jgi:hypothetical protein